MAGIILKGLMGPVTVKGATFSGAVMPAQEAQLSDKKIAAVMTYVRQEWGNKASPVQPAQIVAARKEFKSRTSPWTEADLLQIPADAVLEGGAPAGGAPAAPTSAAPAPATAAVPPTAVATAPAAPGTPPAQPTPPAATVPAGGGFDLAASIERGKPLYMQTCVTCHQPTGQGVPGAFPPLTATEYTTGDARRVVAIVIKGVNPPLKVNNVTYVVPMPPPDLAFPVLKDDGKVADVVNYVRNSFGNKDGKGVTPEFVAAVRKEFESRTAPWTEAELLNFPPPAK
jgi:nitrite reductase (NO-forming)